MWKFVDSIVQAFDILGDFLVACLITERQVLKSPVIIKDMSVSPLIKLYFLYFEALLLGPYTFRILMPS